MSRAPCVPSSAARCARAAERLALGLGQDVHHAGAPPVRLGPAEPQHVDVLAGHRPDHVRSGHEDPTFGAEHHDVGERGAVRRAAGRRAEDDRDLRDPARGLGHHAEDPADGVQRPHALGEPGAARVPQPEDRYAVGQRPLVGARPRPGTPPRPSPRPSRSGRSRTRPPACPSTVPVAASMPLSSTAVIGCIEPASSSAREPVQRVARVLLARRLDGWDGRGRWSCGLPVQGSDGAEGDGDVVAAEAERVVQRGERLRRAGRDATSRRRGRGPRGRRG